MTQVVTPLSPPAEPTETGRPTEGIAEPADATLTQTNRSGDASAPGTPGQGNAPAVAENTFTATPPPANTTPGPADNATATGSTAATPGPAQPARPAGTAAAAGAVGSSANAAGSTNVSSGPGGTTTQHRRLVELYFR